MRTEILTYLKTALASASIKCSQELPWEDSKDALYVKNMKTLYIDNGFTTQTVKIPVLPPSEDVMETITTVRGYFTVDAKSQPSGLEQAMSILASARDITTISVAGREYSYSTDIVGDTVLYTIEYRFVSIT